MDPDASVHESDPDQAPDAGFEPGQLHHLVPGAAGRLLDTRRTPVAVRSVDPEIGTFDVEVLAFEDRGARWVIEAERVSRFQFPAAAPRLGRNDVAGLAAAVARFDRPLHIPIDPGARARTAARLRDEERLAARVLAGVPRVDVDGLLASVVLQGALADHMAGRGLAGMEAAFAARYASNPSAGEIVRGHEVVIAPEPRTFVSTTSTAPWPRASPAAVLPPR